MDSNKMNQNQQNVIVDPFFVDYCSVNKRLYGNDYLYYFVSEGNDNVLFIKRENYENFIINELSILFPLIKLNPSIQLDENNEINVSLEDMSNLGLDISFPLILFFGDVKYRLLEKIGDKRVLQHCINDEFISRIENLSFSIDNYNYSSIFQFCMVYLVLLLGYDGMIEMKKSIKEGIDTGNICTYIIGMSHQKIMLLADEYENSVKKMNKSDDDTLKKYIHDLSFQIAEFSKFMFFIARIQNKLEPKTYSMSQVIMSTINIFDSLCKQGIENGCLFIPVSYDYEFGRKADFLVYPNEDTYMEDQYNNNTVNAIGICVRLVDKDRITLFSAEVSKTLFGMFGSNLSLFVDDYRQIVTEPSESKREFDIRTLEILHDQVRHLEKECKKECDSLTNKTEKDKTCKKYFNEEASLVINRMNRMRTLNENAYFSSLRWFGNNVRYLFGDLCTSNTMLFVVLPDASNKMFDLGQMSADMSGDMFFNEDSVTSNVVSWYVPNSANEGKWVGFFLNSQEKPIIEFNLNDNVGCMSIRFLFENAYESFMQNFEIQNEEMKKSKESIDSKVENDIFKKKREIIRSLRKVKNAGKKFKNRKYNVNAKYILRIMNPTTGDYDYIYEEDLYKNPSKGGILGQVGIVGKKTKGGSGVALSIAKERFLRKKNEKKEGNFMIPAEEAETFNDSKRKEVLSKITSKSNIYFIDDIVEALEYVDNEHFNLINAGISEIGIFNNSDDFKFFLNAKPGDAEEQKIFDYSHGTYGIMSGKMAFNVDNISSDLSHTLKIIVILHEFFHAHFFGTLRTKQDQALSPTSKDGLARAVEFFIVYGEEDEFMRMSSKDKASETSPESIFISEYAQIDEVENYAETAAYYHVLPEALKEKNKKLYDIFNSYFKRYENGEQKEST